MKLLIGARVGERSRPDQLVGYTVKVEIGGGASAARFSEVRLNHRGERCSFEAILEDYKLTDPALHRLGLIVRGADVKGQEKHSLESPGLRAIAQGFALCVSSDEEPLTQEFPIYDALLEYVRHQMCFNRRARSASNPPDLWRFFR